MTARKTAQEIHDVVGALLTRHLVDPTRPSFYTWARDDRAIVSVNPGNLKRIDAVLSDTFIHSLSTVLGGVPIKRLNSVGVFLQIGYTATPPARFVSQGLNLNQQPGPLHLPFGSSKKGPIWLELYELDSLLVGGSRRMGKTTLVHAWIQALLHGGESLLWIRDGKDGTEFHRYQGRPGVTYIADDGLLDILIELEGHIARRKEAYSQVQSTNLHEYNQRVPAGQQLRPIVLIVDEAHTLLPEEAEKLTTMVAKCGAYGIHPVVISQRTGADDIPPALRTNLMTRICFPVPTQGDSVTVIGHAGAENLPKTRGRFLFEWKGKDTEVQAFAVELPGLQRAQISPAVIDLASRALDEHNGRLSIPILVAWGYSERDARTLLDDWQARGWLAGSGQGVARRLSPGLSDQICQSVKVVSKCQS